MRRAAAAMFMLFAALLCSACSRTPTAKEMAAFTTFSVEPAAALVPGAPDAPPTALLAAADDTIRAVLASKGYIEASAVGAATGDFRAIYTIRRSVARADVRSPGALLDAPADHLSITLARRDGRRFWNPAAGDRGEGCLLTADTVRELVREILAPLPANPSVKP